MCSHNIQLEVHLFLWTKWDKNVVCLIFLYSFVFIVCMGECAHMHEHIHLHMPPCTYGGQTLRPLKEKSPFRSREQDLWPGWKPDISVGPNQLFGQGPPPPPRSRRTVSHAKEMGGLAIAFMRCFMSPSQASHSECSPCSPSPWGAAGSPNLLVSKAEKCDFSLLFFLSLTFGRDARHAFSGPLDFLILSLATLANIYRLLTDTSELHANLNNVFLFSVFILSLNRCVLMTGSILSVLAHRILRQKNSGKNSKDWHSQVAAEGGGWDWQPLVSTSASFSQGSMLRKACLIGTWEKLLLSRKSFGIMSSRNNRETPHETSTIWMLRQDPINNTKRCAIMKGEKSHGIPRQRMTEN